VRGRKHTYIKHTDKQKQTKKIYTKETYMLILITLILAIIGISLAYDDYRARKHDQMVKELVDMFDNRDPDSEGIDVGLEEFCDEVDRLRQTDRFKHLTPEQQDKIIDEMIETDQL